MDLMIVKGGQVGAAYGRSPHGLLPNRGGQHQHGDLVGEMRE